jgi:hypothetical protein
MVLAAAPEGVCDVTDLIKVTVDGDRSLHFEAADEAASAGGLELASPDPRVKIKEAVQPLNEALEEALQSLQAMMDQARSTVTLSEISLEVGFVMNAQMGFVIAKGTAGANVKVKIKWRDPAADRMGDEADA